MSQSADPTTGAANRATHFRRMARFHSRKHSRAGEVIGCFVARPNAIHGHAHPFERRPRSIGRVANVGDNRTNRSLPIGVRKWSRGRHLLRASVPRVARRIAPVLAAHIVSSGRGSGRNRRRVDGPLILLKRRRAIVNARFGILARAGRRR
jgi:hypothetical protein